jgi:hypothetical protein
MTVVSSDARETLFQMIAGYWESRCVYVACELGLTDYLVDGPKSVEELATLTNCDAESLYRVMRALASMGIYAETAEESRQFVNTPRSNFFRSDLPLSVRLHARLMLGEEGFLGWSNLLHTVKTGEHALKPLLGMDSWEYFDKNKERGALFNQAMSAMTNAENGVIIPAYDFTPYSVIADIGGSYGVLMSSILKVAPNSKGIVFDLERVINEATKNITDPVLKERCQFIGGDFFKGIPEGADLYIMKHIIHDWNDEEASAILKNVAKAMKPTSKILIIDALIEPGNVPQFDKFQDLSMMVINGRERTEKEFEELLEPCGLKLNKIYNKDKIPLIECVLASK